MTLGQNPEVYRRVCTFGLVFTALIPAFAFVLGGLAKAHEPLLAVSFVSLALGVPFEMSFPIVYSVISLEIGCGIALCLFLARSGLPAIAGLCLLAFFLGLLIRLNPYSNQSASCGCFDSLMGSGLSRSPWTQISIDIGLLFLLVAHLYILAALPARSRVVVDAPKADNDAPQSITSLEEQRDRA